MKEEDSAGIPVLKHAHCSITLDAASAGTSTFGQKIESNNPYPAIGSVASNDNTAPAAATDENSISLDWEWELDWELETELEWELEWEMELKLTEVGSERLKNQQKLAQPIWLYKPENTKTRGRKAQQSYLTPNGRQSENNSPYFLDWTPPVGLFSIYPEGFSPDNVRYLLENVASLTPQIKELTKQRAGTDRSHNTLAVRTSRRLKKGVATGSVNAAEMQQARKLTAKRTTHKSRYTSLTDKIFRLRKDATTLARLARAKNIQHNEYKHLFDILEKFSQALCIPLYASPSSAPKTTYSVNQVPLRQRAMEKKAETKKNALIDWSDKQLKLVENATRCLLAGVQRIYIALKILKTLSALSVFVSSSDSCSDSCQYAGSEENLRQVFENFYRYLDSGDIAALEKMDEKTIEEKIKACVVDCSPRVISDFTQKYHQIFKQLYLEHLKEQHFYCWDSIGVHITSALSELNKKDAAASATQSNALTSSFAPPMAEDSTPASLDSGEDTSSCEYLPQQWVDEPYQVNQAESNFGCVYYVDGQVSADDLVVGAFQESIQDSSTSSDLFFKRKRSYEDYAIAESPATCKKTKYAPAASVSSATLGGGYSVFFAPGFSPSTQCVEAEAVDGTQDSIPLNLIIHGRNSYGH